MLLFAFGVLGLIGLLATSVRATNDARYRTEAANLANGMVADMWTMTAAQMDDGFGAGGAKLDGLDDEGREPASRQPILRRRSDARDLRAEPRPSSSPLSGSCPAIPNATTT